MMTFVRRVALALALVLGVAVVARGQGALSNQVLQLLTRINTWTTTNTFNDLRVANAAIPSVTTYRIYADTSGNLYFNGGLIAGAGGGVTPHNLLSTTHADTVAGAPVRGGLIIANSTPAWAQVALGANHTVLVSNGTDAAWGTDGSGLTGLVAANLTGALPAISGASLTNLNATQLTSGTVPLAALSGITTAQLSAAAGILRSQLSIAAGVVLTTDVTGILPFANGGTGLSTAANSTVLVSSGSAWVAKAVPNCNTTSSALGFTTATNTFSCIAVAVGTGTVTSVAATVPTGFAISGSPITTSGTLAITASNETANTVWAGPTSGGAVAPAFRALVNADLPTSGAVAGSYPYVTVNAQGIVTTGSAAIALGTVTANTPLQVTQTWNSAGIAFTGLQENITNTASAAGSLLADFQLGGVSKWNVDKNGNVTSAGSLTATAIAGTTGAFSGLLSANAGWTVPTGQTGVITDIDALTIAGNKIANTITFTCTELNSSSASGDCVFIADRGYTITGIKFVQYVQGGAGCVADMEKLTGTQAPGGGAVVGTGSYDCNGTANNTVTTYTLSGTPTLAAGNRLAIKLGGTLTALKGLTATVQMKAS